MKNKRLKSDHDTVKQWTHFYKKNIFYHSNVGRLVRSLVFRESSLVEFGSRGGELLRNLPNKNKVGVECNKDYLSLNVKRKRKANVYHEADFWKKYGRSKFDVIILNNNLSETEDIQTLLSKLKNISRPDTKIIVIFFNYLWKPILDITQKLKLRMPYFREPNWLSVEDVKALFAIEDFDEVKSGKKILIPIHIPLIADFANRYLSVLPIVGHLSLLNYLVFKCKRPKKDYSSSIIIPLRNEEGNIRGLINKIPRFGKSQEIIFVEGNSTDNTYSAVKKEMLNYKGEMKIFLHKQRGEGKADAVRLGLSRARNEILITFDGDLTVDPGELPKFYKALVSDKGDFVMGSRLVYPLESQAMRTLNVLGNKLFGLVFSYVLNQPIKDTLCGTKLLFRRDYEKINYMRKYFGKLDPFGDFELIFGASKLNLKILEIPVRYKQRTYGETNIKRFVHGIMLFRMVVIALRKLKFI